jgi:hypothetical protein
MDEPTGSVPQLTAVTPRDMIISAVNSTVAALRDGELAALYLSVVTGSNPKSETWYSRVAHLFTEEDSTRMHPEVEAVLEQIIHKRLSD